MTGIKFSQRIFLRANRSNTSGCFYLNVFLNGNRLKINLNLNAPIKGWDKDKQILKGNTDQVHDVNLALENYKKIASEIVVRHRLLNKPLSKEKFLAEFENPLESECFIRFLEQEISNRKGIIADSTRAQHRKVLNNLKAFKGRISFSDIDYLFFKEFEMWLAKVKGNEANTRFTNFKVIKSYWKIAEKKGLCTGNPFKDFPIKKVPGDRTWLTVEEVTRLHFLLTGNKVREEYERVSLRAFLFSCHTGVRLSDVRKLHHKNIKDGILTFIPRKTASRKNESISIPLSSLARELVDDKAYFFGSLPADQQINRYLKVFAKKANIDKNITFHVARHSFATNFYRSTKDVLSLKKLLGHSKIEETMIYVNMAGVDSLSAMEIYAKRLSDSCAGQRKQGTLFALDHR